MKQQAQSASDAVTQAANDVATEVKTQTDQVISTVVATGTTYLQQAQIKVEDAGRAVLNTPGAQILALKAEIGLNGTAESIRQVSNAPTSQADQASAVPEKSDILLAVNTVAAAKKVVSLAEPVVALTGELVDDTLTSAVDTAQSMSSPIPDPVDLAVPNTPDAAITPQIDPIAPEGEGNIRMGLGLGEAPGREGYRAWASPRGLWTWDEIAPKMYGGDFPRVQSAMRTADELHFNMEGFVPPTRPQLGVRFGQPIGSYTDFEYSMIRTQYAGKSTFWLGSEPYIGPHPF